MAFETKTITELAQWAKSADAGDYLVTYEESGDDGLDGSRCGYSDMHLAEVKLGLRDRDLALVADDRGLVVEARRSID